MEIQKFIEIVANPHEITKNDFNELLELKKLFPYFQISSILVCIASQKQKNLFFNDHLKEAALSSVNRTKLKEHLVKNTVKELTHEQSTINTEENREIISSIINVQETHNEISESLIPATEEPSVTTIETSPEEKYTPIHYEKTPYFIHLQALDNQRLQTSPFELDMINEYNNLVFNTINDTPTDNQNEIIDAFLDNLPKRKFQILPAQEEAGGKEDLSEKYTSNSDDFFSESLAIIYTKQGKYSKALETYRKLILSNPQKSAYFASKISELENLS